MDSTPPKKIAFVLTSSGDDVFARMQRLAIQSVRQHMPACHVVLLTDIFSAKHLRAKAHNVIASVDELIEIDSPANASAKWTSRWLKTGLRDYLQGDILFLDTDVIVRDDIGCLWSCDSDLGGVPDCNAKGVYFSPFEETEYPRMGWRLPHHGSINTGVLFWRDTARTHRLAKRWRECWLKYVEATGAHFDQIAFNHVVDDLHFDITFFSSRFNAQGRKNPAHFLDAAIWHFMASNDFTRFPRDYWEQSLKKMITGHTPDLGWTKKRHPFIQDGTHIVSLLQSMSGQPYVSPTEISRLRIENPLPIVLAKYLYERIRFVQKRFSSKYSGKMAQSV